MDEFALKDLVRRLEDHRKHVVAAQEVISDWNSMLTLAKKSLQTRINR